MVLSIHYLPCVYWFQQLLSGAPVVLDQHEHYVKQSYRNRCVILSANGPLALTIPVKKREHNQPVGSIEIENDFAWQKQHWEAIRSAYNSSPFFIYYEHHFASFYQKEFALLAEFNLGLIDVCLTLLKVERNWTLSEHYLPSGDGDLRQLIHPKRNPDSAFRPYLQVFSEKFPFIPNLSVIDVLFNKGPHALESLKLEVKG